MIMPRGLQHPFVCYIYYLDIHKADMLNLYILSCFVGLVLFIILFF